MGLLLTKIELIENGVEYIDSSSKCGDERFKVQCYKVHFSGLVGYITVHGSFDLTSEIRSMADIEIMIQSHFK